MIIDGSFLENIGIEVARENDSEILFKCPFHDDTNPSASFNVEELVYNCFVCGGGNLQSLARKLGFNDLANKIKKIPPSIDRLRRELDLLIEPDSKSTDYFNQEFETINYEFQCPEYLSDRLNFDTILEFDLHICEEKSSIYNERIIFPLKSKYSKGFIARDYTEVKPQKYLFPKDMPKQEYLFGKIKDDEIILVEGVFDVMKLWEHGYKSCICPSGVTFSNEQATLLLENNVQTITIFPDGDVAGIKFKNRMKDFLNLFEIYVVMPEESYFIDGKDPFESKKQEIDYAISNRYSLNERVWQEQKDSMLN